MHTHTRRAAAAAGLLVMLATGATVAPAGAAPTDASAGAEGTRCAGRGDLPRFGPGPAYHPVIEASDFTANVDNPWFPLQPGTTLIYEGTKDGKAARNVFAITNDTLVVDGVTTRVVFDRLYLDGVLAERTLDYYAQDDDGTVWYFGEDTRKLDDHGHLTDTSGSFRAGVDGAEPGIFMESCPELGRRFRQEWYQGEAEDRYRAVAYNTSVTVPYRTFDHALKTEETTDLEPGVLDNKYYVHGLGEVEETSVSGPVETLRLVEVRR